MTQMLGLGKTRVRGIENDLRDAFVVPKIDEDQPAVIAAAIYPAVELDRRAFVDRRAARHTKS